MFAAAVALVHVFALSGELAALNADGLSSRRVHGGRSDIRCGRQSLPDHEQATEEHDEVFHPLHH